MNKEYIYKLSGIINQFHESYIGQHCNGPTLHGYYLTENAPSTFKELVEYRHCNVLPVYSGGSDATIYEHAYQNYNFRFVHDLHHIKLNKDFSFEGELATIKSQYMKLLRWSFSVDYTRQERMDLLKLFLIDTTGQIDYYYKNKKYVGDQLSFALDGMSKPVHDLLMITGCQL